MLFFFPSRNLYVSFISWLEMNSPTCSNAPHKPATYFQIVFHWQSFYFSIVWDIFIVFNDLPYNCLKRNELFYVVRSQQITTEVNINLLLDKENCIQVARVLCKASNFKIEKEKSFLWIRYRLHIRLWLQMQDLPSTSPYCFENARKWE